jgi:pyruvate kinase
MIRAPHKTKIVATIGPASESVSTLEKMIRAGMNIARLNFSHGEFAAHGRMIENIRAAEKAAAGHVTIMADLSGPKMRVGRFGADKIALKSGDRFTLTTDDIVGDQQRVSVSFARLPAVVKRGDTLSLNDGYIQMEVAEVHGADVVCSVMVGGELRSRKGLNLPNIDLGIGAFTERDRECLKFALENGVDSVSQSFVECAADMHAVRKAAREMGYEPFLIAKIERSRALGRLDEIIDAADGIMIARGDLGVEIPIEQIAVVQKNIMRRVNQRAKPVITATQMLESMTAYRLPTRAEATDVSNAILDGTDCVMLSGESAMGAYPVESVAMLARIAASVEPIRRPISVRELFSGMDLSHRIRPEHLIAVSIESSIEFLKPAAVFVQSVTGGTARRLAALHLPAPVVAVSTNRRVCQGLLFSYGVTPVYEPAVPESWTEYAKTWLRSHEVPGEFAIVTQRIPGEDPAGNHRMEIINL